MTNEPLLLYLSSNLETAIAPPAPPQTVTCMYLPRQKAINVVGARTGNTYRKNYELRTRRQELFVYPDMEVVRVKAGGYPWIALIATSGVILVALIVVIVLNNNKIARACRVEGNTVTPVCGDDEIRKHKLSGALTILPALVLALSIVGYLLVDGPLRKRANAKECDARGYNWFPGHAQNANVWSKLLCRSFGVCDCYNDVAQTACMRLGFVAEGTIPRLNMVSTADISLPVDEETRLASIEERRVQAVARQNEQEQLADALEVPVPSDSRSSAPDDEKAESILSSSIALRSGESQQGGAPIRKPLIAWNQKKANSVLKIDYDNACCPTSSDSPFKKCHDCGSGDCVVNI